MNIFVISLEKSVDRRKHVLEQFSKTNLDFTFFNAIAPENGFSEYFDSYNEEEYLLNTGRKATNGEIGCYASHLALWKQCVENNEPILIMEDDFILDNRFTEAVAKTKTLIQQYGYIRLQVEHRGKYIMALKEEDFSLVYYTKMPHSLMCYAISPTIAKNFIAKAKYLEAPVDVMIKKIWSHKQRLYGLLPYTVDDSSHHYSTNIPGRIKQPKSFRIKLLRFFRKISWIYKRIAFTFNFKPPSV